MEKIDKIFNENPRQPLWNRLEEKLDGKKKVKKLRIYRITSLAAMFVALIAVVSYFSHILNDHNPHLFASNEDFSSLVLEELEYDENGIFNLEGLIELSQAYKRHEVSASRNVIGDYTAKDGEIGFNIKLKDLSYHLLFDYDDFPGFTLEKVEGQTWYFNSKNDYQLKLNLEPYGFKLIGSNFLPEYNNYMFAKISEI